MKPGYFGPYWKLPKVFLWLGLAPKRVAGSSSIKGKTKKLTHAFRVGPEDLGDLSDRLLQSLLLLAIFLELLEIRH